MRTSKLTSLEKDLLIISAPAVGVLEAISTALPAGTARDLIQAALPLLLVVTRLLGKKLAP